MRCVQLQEKKAMIENCGRWDFDFIPPVDTISITLDVSPLELELADDLPARISGDPVRINPGQTVVTRMPSEASSARKPSDRPVSANLLAEYAPSLGEDTTPATDPVGYCQSTGSNVPGNADPNKLIPNRSGKPTQPGKRSPWRRFVMPTFWSFVPRQR